MLMQGRILILVLLLLCQVLFTNEFSIFRVVDVHNKQPQQQSCSSGTSVRSATACSGRSLLLKAL